MTISINCLPQKYFIKLTQNINKKKITKRRVFTLFLSKQNIDKNAIMLYNIFYKENNMDIKRYMKDSLVTPELLQSYFVECGGYQGVAKHVSFEASVYNNKFVYECMKGDEIVYLTPEQTAFGNYLKAIKLLSVGRDNKIDLRDKTKRDYNQGIINRNIEDLVLLASKYISKENHKISYDCQKFQDSVKDKFPDLAEIAPLMPYVLHYVALRQGYNLTYPHEIIKPFKKEDRLKANLNTEIYFSPRNKVTDADMLMAIGNHMHVNYEKFLPENDRKLKK